MAENSTAAASSPDAPALVALDRIRGLIVAHGRFDVSETASLRAAFDLMIPLCRDIRAAIEQDNIEREQAIAQVRRNG